MDFNIIRLYNKTAIKVKSDVAPDAEETINYNIPTFKLNGNLVHFAGYEKHIGFYPTPTGIEVFKEELSSYKPAKDSVKFPINKPIPYNIVKKIVEFRVKENLNKKKYSVFIKLE